MLSDFNSFDRNIEILSEFTGINIEFSDSKNISCQNPVCNALYDLKSGKSDSGCVFLCKCGLLYFCVNTDKCALVLSPVDVDSLSNPSKQNLVFKRLNAYYLLKAINDHSHSFSLTKKLKEYIIIEDERNFIKEIEFYLLKLIDEFGNELFTIKSKLTEIILELLNNEKEYNSSGIEKGKIPAIIKNIWDTDVLSVLFDSLKELCNLIFTKKTSTARQSKADTIAFIIEYINRKYNENITLDDLSKKVFVSKAYLSRIFTEVTGETFLTFLNKTRAEKSKYYLKNTDMSISAIALKVGYTNSGYYSKMFRKVTHLSPTQYRLLKERMPKNVDM